jgi:hypothetical protein
MKTYQATITITIDADNEREVKNLIITGQVPLYENNIELTLIGGDENGY